MKWLTAVFILVFWVLSLPGSMFLAGILTELGWKSSALWLMWGWFGITLVKGFLVPTPKKSKEVTNE